MVAKPPETIELNRGKLNDCSNISIVFIIYDFTKELLGDFSGLDNFNDTRVQLFNSRNVVGEDTHVTRGSSQVDLLNISSLVDSLYRRNILYLISCCFSGSIAIRLFYYFIYFYLVRDNESQTKGLGSSRSFSGVETS